MITGSVGVAQVGSRMHYAVPRMFDRAGMLDSLYTDLQPSRWALRLLGARVARYGVRFAQAKVYSNNAFGLAVRLARRSAGLEVVALAERALISAMERQFSRRLGSSDMGAVYAFDTAALGFFRTAREAGAARVLEQCVAPRTAQLRLYDMLEDQGIYRATDEHRRSMRRLGEREREEWALADRIIVPSAYVRDEVLGAGCDAGRVRVVPYGYGDGPDAAAAVRRRRPGPLRLVFAGAVGARKGFHDVAAAVGRFGGRVEVDAYGALHFDPSRIAAMGEHVRVHGPVPFARLKAAFLDADMLVLPSYLEGSATVVYEALSFGLPCLVTHQTGSVVTDGHDGFVVPAGDTEVLAARIDRLLGEPEMIERLSANALATSRSYTVARYQERLFEALGVPAERA
jgi:glycosyltransferase involved in cell wall biosynthesis